MGAYVCGLRFKILLQVFMIKTSLSEWHIHEIIENIYWVRSLLILWPVIYLMWQDTLKCLELDFEGLVSMSKFHSLYTNACEKKNNLESFL